MGKQVVRFTLLGITLAAACSGETDPVAGPDPAETVTGSGARILRADGAPLTGPSTAARATIATEYLRGRASASSNAGSVAGFLDLKVVSEVTGRGGVTHVRVEQTAGGLRVHGAYAKVAMSDRGEVLQLIDHLAPAGGVAPASANEREALAAAMTELGYSTTSDFHRAPTVERVAYVAAGGLREGFLVETWSDRGNQLDHTLVDGHGKIVAVERRTNNDSYRVFVEDPDKGAQTVVSGPGSGNVESPIGWLGAGAQTSIDITGNNAHAYLDAVSNNAPDSGGSSVGDGNFLATADLAVSPSTTGNRDVAVQNLFYLNNVIHDELYRHGFNEAAGNFQADNFGLGGNGNDPVQAEAQDGGGTDNANFSTPSDGSAPRMQMYLWSGAGPNAFVTVANVDHGAWASSFGRAVTAAGTTGPLAVYTDGTAPTSDGCEASTVSLTGKVAIVDRGTCTFTVKVWNAQRAGAIAVVIANNAATSPFAPGGTDRKVRIPSAMVSQADGNTLRGLAGASAVLRTNPVLPLQIDGDVDADIVFHEYGHGLTWRMIGGMSGKLAGAVGEGASDVLAYLINGDDRIGEYSFSDALGIRRYPYTSYPLTYGAVDGGGVHADGEIYAGAMWRVRENYLAAGLTADDLLGDFVDGMNFTPATPAFEDMRDGLLQSADPARACLIWRGFAAQGIGAGADGRVSPSGRVTIVESFTLPTECQ